MYEDWESLQKVDIGNTEELCEHCNSDLTDIANFTFKDEIRTEPHFWQELCKCQKCGAKFIMHYDIFDSAGHIYQRVFTEDINNEHYSWTENLTDQQKVEISSHLKDCKTCKDRLSQEQLGEAIIKEFFSTLRKKIKKEK